MNKYWVAYAEHYATGEGVTTMLAVANDEENAIEEFHHRFPVYVRKTARIQLLNSAFDAEDGWVVDMIPDHVWELMDEIDGLRYHAQMHYNLA